MWVGLIQSVQDINSTQTDLSWAKRSLQQIAFGLHHNFSSSCFCSGCLWTQTATIPESPSCCCSPYQRLDLPNLHQHLHLSWKSHTFFSTKEFGKIPLALVDCLKKPLDANACFLLGASLSLLPICIHIFPLSYVSFSLWLSGLCAGRVSLLKHSLPFTDPILSFTS